MTDVVFTPGPWEFSSDGIWAASPWNARVKIATVGFFAEMNGINSKANGRLIAAAPDLLRCLKEAHSYVAFARATTTSETNRANAARLVDEITEAICKAALGSEPS